MFLYYFDSGFFKPGRKSEMMRARVIRLCETDCPLAVLIHGDIHYSNTYQRFVRTLHTMHIPCAAVQSSFEKTEYYPMFHELSARTLRELCNPAVATLYKIHKDQPEPTRIYMQLFVHHTITDEPDFMMELEKRIQGMGSVRKLRDMKLKMN